MGDRLKELFSTQKSMKKNILYQIRTTLLQKNSTTKVELSQLLEISFPTISKFISEMEGTGEILELGLDESSGGRRAKRYSLNSDYAYGLAVFLERNELHFTVFDCFGEVKEKGKVASILKDNGLSALTECIKKNVSKYKNIRSIAIGVPGAVENGTIFFIPDYEELQQVNVKKYVEDMFSIPVVVENDMNASIVGYSSRSKIENSVYLYLGQNGPGAGIMVNGDVIRGNTFFSGEVSFVPQYDELNFFEALLEKKIDSISRLVASLVAIINPHTIIFTDEEIDGKIVERIRTCSEKYVPKQHIPVLDISNLEMDYLQGLQSIGIEQILLGEGCK